MEVTPCFSVCSLRMKTSRLLRSEACINSSSSSSSKCRYVMLLLTVLVVTLWLNLLEAIPSDRGGVADNSITLRGAWRCFSRAANTTDDAAAAVAPQLHIESAALDPLPFPAHAFWHIGNTGLSTWRMVVLEQIDLIYQSHLLDAMNVTAVYVGDDESLMPQTFYDSRISIRYGGRTDQYEYATLRQLEAYCERQPQARVIYFHTKGASKSLNNDYGLNCYGWRKLMEHFVITLHRTILLNELNDTSSYQVAGIEEHPDHFSGNFWLAKCAWINDLKRLNEVNTKDRMLAEKWIGFTTRTGPGSSFQDVSVNCRERPPNDTCPDRYKCYVPDYEYRSIKACRGKPEKGFTYQIG